MRRTTDATGPRGDDTIFDPSEGSLPDRVAARYEDASPAVPIVGTYVAAWTALSAVFTAVGLLLVEVILTGGVGRWDASVNRWLVERRTPWVDDVTSVATFMANTIPVIVVAAVCCGVFLLLGRWKAAVFLAGALLLEVTVFLTVNTLVDRSRPDVPRMDSTPSTGSFPSGHAAASLVLWVALAIIVSSGLRRRVVTVVTWTVAVLVALAIAFARTYRGMHHVTDVVVGMAVGASALAMSLLAVRVVSGTVARHRERSYVDVVDAEVIAVEPGAGQPSPSHPRTEVAR